MTDWESDAIDSSWAFVFVPFSDTP